GPSTSRPACGPLRRLCGSSRDGPGLTDRAPVEPSRRHPRADATFPEVLMDRRWRWRRVALATAVFGTSVANGIAGQALASTTSQHAQEYRHYDGPPVTLQVLLQDATDQNPDVASV